MALETVSDKFPTSEISSGRNRSFYKMFLPGDDFSFTLCSLKPNGEVTQTTQEAEIEAVKGGGFFGRVLILKDKEYVLKTSVPDPWHDLWRRVNWGFRDFPSQINETQAQLDHLSTNLISDVLPVLTKGEVYSPRSFGYARLPNGYAQAIERVRGRSPKYDNGDDEFKEFRQQQKSIRMLGYELGLEQAAQIHEDNPYGMANLWRDLENDSWIWMDTLPAIPHNGWIWPCFRFRFHKDVRKWFYPHDPSQITFNKIHTDRFRDIISANRQVFDDETFTGLLDNLDLYENLNQFQPPPRRNFPAAAQAVFAVTKDTVLKTAQKVPEIVTTPPKFLDEKYRHDFIKKAVLLGVEKAYTEGLVSMDKYQNATAILKSPNPLTLRTIAALGTTAAYQELSSLALKAPELFVYTQLGMGDVGEELIRFNLTPLLNVPDLLEKALTMIPVFLGFRALHAINKFTSARLIGKGADVDLKATSFLSVIPTVGILLAIPAQIAICTGNRDKSIWHYTVRNLLASFCFNPAGGWGTQLEGERWNLIGKRIEKLADTSSQKSDKVTLLP